MSFSQLCEARDTADLLGMDFQTACDLIKLLDSDANCIIVER